MKEKKSFTGGKPSIIQSLKSLNSMVQSEYSLRSQPQFGFPDSQLFEYMGTQAARHENLSR